MRTVSLILSITSILIITGCASTSDFSKRKYTKGRFKTHNKLKKFKAEKQIEEVSISEIVDVPKVEVTENLEPKIDHIFLPILNEKGIIEKGSNQNGNLLTPKEKSRVKKNNLKLNETESHQIERTDEESPALEEEQVDAEQKARNTSALASIGMLLSFIGLASFYYMEFAPILVFVSFVGLILAVISLCSPYKTKHTQSRALIAVGVFGLTIVLWIAVFSYFLYCFLPGFTFIF